MTPAEYGARLARQAGPLTDDQVEQAARILAPLCVPTGASSHPVPAGSTT